MEFLADLLSDPRAFAVNTLPPHSDHNWYATAEEMEAAKSSYNQSLDGLWKFYYAENLEAVPTGFFETRYDTGDWDEIEVPSHIQMRGYDRPQYVNTQYPWDGLQDIAPPVAPEDFNPTACYVKRFALDTPLGEDQKVTVCFDGAESALAVWLNGEFVGYAEDSFTPAEFDITRFLVEGENTIAVAVFKWCSGSWLEDQDFFRFSGLFRSVHLRVWPKTHAVDVRTGVDLADDLQSATVTVNVDLEGAGSVTGSLGGREMENDGLGQLRLTIDKPHLWSAEDPYLYHLVLTVRDESGTPTEYIPQRVGVRRFAVEDGLLKINGERVVFLGVNRHEFGLNGRVITREETEADLALLKGLGANAIRTSHYPNNSFFYDLADEYGFYVIDEMNLETHGLWDEIRFGPRAVEDAVPGDDPAWLPAVLDRAANMYCRDKNHPSIVMWSCGNESFGGSNLLAVADYFRSVDSRPVHYEGVAWDPRFPNTTDVRSEMYTPAAQVEEYLQENRDKPFILCEYAHAMGNSFGAVDRYIDLAYRDPLFQGGFIWDFADQAIAVEDRYGREFWAYGGDHGEVPHDGEFCGNGIFFVDRTPTPRVQEVKYLYQPLKLIVTQDSVSVANRYNFTDTGDLDCTVLLSKEGERVAEATLETGVAPGEEETYQLPLALPETPGEYTIDVVFTVRDAKPGLPSGHTVAREQAVLKVEGANDTNPTGSSEMEVIEGIHNIGVHGDRFSVLFSHLQGGMVGYTWRDDDGVEHQMLKAVPMPNFWHAPTSNERAWGGPFEDGQWLLASRYAKYTPHSPTFGMVDGSFEIRFLYDLPTVPKSNAQVDYCVHPSGKVDVTLTLNPGKGVGDLPEIGMLFETDASLDSLTWYGEGPEESYADRRGGAHVGVYTRDVASQLTPYLRPQESGNHTEVRWAEVRSASGLGLRFEGTPTMEFSAQHWSPFEVENARHPNELPPVHRTYIRPALARRGVAGDDT